MAHRDTRSCGPCCVSTLEILGGIVDDMERAEAHVWEILNKWGISENTSDTGTVENMLSAGLTLAEIAKAADIIVEPHVSWL